MNDSCGFLHPSNGHYRSVQENCIYIRQCRFALIAASVMAVASARAGTFSLVSVDMSLISATGSGSSVVANGAGEVDASIYDLAIANRSSQDLIGYVQGTAVFTVDWTPGYVGEPVPDDAVVAFTVTGHEYIAGGADSYIGPPTTFLFRSRLTDDFVSWVEYVVTAGPGYVEGSQTNSTLGTIYGGTGSFTYIGGNVYQSTIDLTLNLMGEADASATPFGRGSAITDQLGKYRISNIGGQSF